MIRFPLSSTKERGIEWGAYKQQIKEKLNNFTDDEYFTIVFGKLECQEEFFFLQHIAS